MSCVLSCANPTVRIKACGGLGPYTWSKTGNVRLSKTTGVAITVNYLGIAVASTSTGLFPGQNACVIPAVGVIQYQRLATSMPCRVFDIDVSLHSTAWTYFDCDGNSHGAGPLGISGATFCADESPQCDQAPCPVTNPECVILNATAWGNGCKNDETDLIITCHVPVQNDHASVYDETITIPIGSGAPNPGTTFAFPKKIDIRTQAMVNGGCGNCGCDEPTGVTITVTDDAGVQSTVVLAV